MLKNVVVKTQKPSVSLKMWFRNVVATQKSYIKAKHFQIYTITNRRL